MSKNEKVIDLEQIKRIKAGQPSMQDLKELSRDEINRIQYGEFLTAIGKKGYSIKDVFDEFDDKSPLIRRLKVCMGLHDIKKCLRHAQLPCPLIHEGKGFSYVLLYCKILL